MVSFSGFTYTGHETFSCRSYWLKKGYDFLENNFNFNSPEAPSRLGVGKNMVRSIKFWLKAFALIEDNQPSFLAVKIFNTKDGWDPYLEDVNTIWLLHYLLVKHGYARIYSDFFNEFRKRQNEFTFENFERFLKMKLPNVAENSLKSDINVLKNNYVRHSRKNVNIEDSFSVFLQEINLIDNVSSGIYLFNTRKKKSLDDKIILFSILDNFYGNTSISFDTLMYEKNSPGTIFCLTQEELFHRITSIEKLEPGLVFTEDAGVRELQIDKNFFSNIYKVLESYYERRKY